MHDSVPKSLVIQNDGTVIFKEGNKSLGILVFFALLAIFAPLVAPYDPHQMYKPLEHPNSAHLLGTNDIGQDY
ncbi:MAG: hypothetical protein C4B56_00445 [Candidatus Methanophagaceae archaeon]|nr:MAG: hypothetical protein C4B56_00445 [Methanophagales archaeon]